MTNPATSSKETSALVPILIGGTGRSGTTVLKRVLGQHPAIVAIPQELRVTIDPGGALDLVHALTEGWSPFTADAALNDFKRLMRDCEKLDFWHRGLSAVATRLGFSPRRYWYMQLGKHFGRPYFRHRVATLIEELSHHISQGYWSGTTSYRRSPTIHEVHNRSIDPLSQHNAAGVDSDAAPDAASSPSPLASPAPAIATLFDDLYTAAAKSQNKQPTHWLDDTPYNVCHARALEQLFPRARFIHMYRDPRDVLASHKRFQWGGDNAAAIARRIVDVLDRWQVQREELPRDAWLDVALEELAASPVEVFEQIAEFSGISMDDAVRKAASEIQPDRVHTGRWKQELTESELAKAMPILDPVMERYGYAIDE